jgi:DNA-binding transcriptional MerR regulator
MLDIRGKVKGTMKKISEVCKLTGVTRRTLQFYDEEGLLHTNRSSENYRLYDRNTLENIWQILVYKEMGFRLKEIKDILMVSEQNRTCFLKQKTEALQNQMTQISAQIRLIQQIQEKGMPSAPNYDVNGRTYKEQVTRLRGDNGKGD